MNLFAIISGYENIRTAPTLEQPELVAALHPMLRAINKTIQSELAEYHDFAFERSLLTWRPEKENDDLSRVPRLPEELRDSWPEKDYDYSVLSDNEINEQYAR